MVGIFATEMSDAQVNAAMNEMQNNPEMAAGVYGMLAGMGFIFAIVGFIWYVLQVIAYWKIFAKAGEPGWKSIIPFYNTYTQFKITWKTSIFWLQLCLTALCGGLNAVASKSDSFILGLILAVVAIAIIVISILQDFKLSVSYGHGIGFTLGLIFFDPIFKLILGFGDSEYIGPEGIPSNR